MDIKQDNIEFYIHVIPEQAKDIYKKENFSLDQYYACLNTVTIWRKPLPEALLDNELITEIVKTIPTLE